MLDVCLLGTSGMLPLPNRWLTALMTRFNGSSLLIDCGEGTQIAIKEKGWSFNPIDVICFTHYHADHISGLPGLLLTIGNSDRTEPVTLIGPKGLERVVSALRTIAPELPFELRFIELTNPREHISIKGYEIDFSRDIYEYTLKIGNEDVLDITPVLEDNNSSYIITGNDKLVNGSVIKIKVITDENNEKVYTINILKDKEIEVVKNNNYKYIFIVMIGVLLIINIVRFLRRRKKNEE